MKTDFNSVALGLTLSLGVAACGDDGGKTSVEPPNHYEFQSRFDSSKSSVSYSGQTARHIMIADLTAYLGRLDTAIRKDDFLNVPFFDPYAIEETCHADLVAAFNRYFRAGVGEVPWLDDEPMLLTTDPPKLASQVTYGDISKEKNLVGKLAGNDTSTDAVDWSVSLANVIEINVLGESHTPSSPTELVDTIFAKVAEFACDAIVNGVPAEPIYVDEMGVDHQQLLQKFLLGAVALSQGADDYLDDDLDGKGILSPNTRDGEALHTKLEHAWDEGFGYYGAAVAALSMDLASIAGPGHEDVDGDGFIDLRTEKNYGASTNAAKRDRGACVPTRITEDAMRAFIAGRHLISRAGEELTEAELEELRGYRDAAVMAWEQAIAATAIHYANECLADLAALRAEDDSYSRVTHAKHWSEMVGFLMSLQFSPHSPWLVRGNGAESGPTLEFLELLELAGGAPRTDEDAEDALIALREALGDAYGFALANVQGDGADCAGW